MRFAYLGSGSRGNAALIEAGKTRLLLDCGFSVTETRRRLARLGLEPESLTGIMVTHEHSDHLSGVERLARRYSLPVWMTPGTRAAWSADSVPELELISAHDRFLVNDIEVSPYPVPHDAREPCQYVFSDGVHRLGVLSDAGTITPFIREQLSGCNALLLECNHDPDMLTRGPYPDYLKRRVGGPLGHLSNAQAASLLEAIDTDSLSHLVVAHLSEKNNTADLARTSLAMVMNCTRDWIAVANQARGLDWREMK